MDITIPELDALIPDIIKLKKRNHLLEKTLANIADVLGTPSPEKTKKTKTKTKKKKKKTKTGFTWCGKEGKFDAYRCKECIAIVRGDKIEKHRCMPHNKKRKSPDKKSITQGNTKKRRTQAPKPKSFDGFTLFTTDIETSTLYHQCDRCSYMVDEKEVPLHRCNTPVVQSVEKVVPLTLVDVDTREDNPKYSGPIEGWTWAEYRNNFSCYRCESCYIVMRHDFIDRHKCSRNRVEIKMEPNEHDIVL